MINRLNKYAQILVSTKLSGSLILFSTLSDSKLSKVTAERRPIARYPLKLSKIRKYTKDTSPDKILPDNIVFLIETYGLFSFTREGTSITNAHENMQTLVT